jgi:hypothetical protein
MDWQRAIEINREALTRIVAGLVALLGLQAGGTATSIAPPVYQLVARILHPAESAVRRLIVIAARGLVVASQPARPMPPGLVIERKSAGRSTFQLFDTRKSFPDDDEADAITGPRIRSIGDPDPRSLFLAKFAAARALQAAEQQEEMEAARLSRRVMLLKKALDTLPQQARRLVRWQARRAEMKGAKFTSPMRPGPAPGHRKKPKDEIDFVLRECHGLAWDVLNPNTS